MSGKAGTKRAARIKDPKEARAALKALWEKEGWEGYKSFAEVEEYALVMGINRILTLSRFGKVSATKIKAKVAKVKAKKPKPAKKAAPRAKKPNQTKAHKEPKPKADTTPAPAPESSSEAAE